MAVVFFFFLRFQEKETRCEGEAEKKKQTKRKQEDLSLSFYRKKLETSLPRRRARRSGRASSPEARRGRGRAVSGGGCEKREGLENTERQKN